MRTASDLMRRHVIALAPGDTVATAFEMMRLGRIRQLPVVEDLLLVGEISFRDLSGAYRELFRPRRGASRAHAQRLQNLQSRSIAALVRPPEDLVVAETPLAQVVRALIRRGAGFVPVVDPGGRERPPRLLGVVTERDLIREVLGRPTQPAPARRARDRGNGRPEPAG